MIKSEFLSFEKVDRSIFLGGILTVVAVSLPLALFPDAASAVLGKVLSAITANFSWLYLLTGAGAFFFMMWLAFSRYGRIRLAAVKCHDEGASTFVREEGAHLPRVPLRFVPGRAVREISCHELAHLLDRNAAA